MTILLTPTRHWVCPNCTLTDMTHEAQPHTRYHACKGLKGLSAPMVPAGTNAKVTAIERQDYIGTETVQTDAEGRPVMAVVTEREDGSNDVAVFAPTANGKAEEL
jgi:hypothetical protein